MKIRWIDAIDVFGQGGYIDLQTMKYIAPKWFSDLCPENNTGYSDEDYISFSQNPDRFMTPPIIRLSGLHCCSAMKMGMTREELVQIGFDKNEYWDIFIPRKKGDNDNWLYECSDAEWNSIKAIDAYMISNGKYYAYLMKDNEVMKSIIQSWLSQHGIDPY